MQLAHQDDRIRHAVALTSWFRVCNMEKENAEPITQPGALGQKLR